MNGTRRQFLQVLASFGVGSQGVGVAEEAKEAVVHTVLGPIPASKLGPTLAHEHVLCDFIGAEQTHRERWKVENVVRVMRPYLIALKERSFTGFMDCTPAFIGRDPRVLRRLSEEAGVHIITNTGYYGGANDKYVPRHAYSENEDALAARWEREWNEGIEETRIKPGFMKIGVDEVEPGSRKLSEIDSKLVRAAAKVSRSTRLAAVCHTGGGPAGLEAAKIFIKEKGDPSRFVVAHADGHGLPTNLEAAAMGVWVSLDAISRQPLELHLKLVTAMLEKHPERLLISHDNGWYSVGTEDGGEVRDFNYIADTFLPALRARGVTQEMIHALTCRNPARAIAIQPA